VDNKEKWVQNIVLKCLLCFYNRHTDRTEHEQECMQLNASTSNGQQGWVLHKQTQTHAKQGWALHKQGQVMTSASSDECKWRQKRAGGTQTSVSESRPARAHVEEDHQEQVWAGGDEGEGRLAWMSAARTAQAKENCQEHMSRREQEIM